MSTRLNYSGFLFKTNKYWNWEHNLRENFKIKIKMCFIKRRHILLYFYSGLKHDYLKTDYGIIK